MHTGQAVFNIMTILSLLLLQNNPVTAFSQSVTETLPQNVKWLKVWHLCNTKAPNVIGTSN